MLGFFVVNGKFEIFAFRRVAALNKVVFPVFVFPIIAIVNKEKTLDYILCALKDIKIQNSKLNL